MYISKKAIVKSKKCFGIILGNSFIDENTYIDFNAIIGYPSRTKLLGIDSCENIFEKLDELSNGSKIGKNVIIRSGCVIYENVIVNNNVEFGHNVLIRENTYIDKNCRIGSYTIIEGSVKIGKNVNIQSMVYIPKSVIIEDNVFIGPCVIITNDKYPPSKRIEKVIIRKGAVIGAGSIILPGVEIGEYAVVGAGSIVTRDVRSGEVVIGNPAKLTYTRQEYEIKKSLYEFL